MSAWLASATALQGMSLSSKVFKPDITAFLISSSVFPLCTIITDILSGWYPEFIIESTVFSRSMFSSSTFITIPNLIFFLCTTSSRVSEEE